MLLSATEDFWCHDKVCSVLKLIFQPLLLFHLTITRPRAALSLSSGVGFVFGGSGKLWLCISDVILNTLKTNWKLDFNVCYSLLKSRPLMEVCKAESFSCGTALWQLHPRTAHADEFCLLPELLVLQRQLVIVSCSFHQGLKWVLKWVVVTSLHGQRWPRA